MHLTRELPDSLTTPAPYIGAGRSNPTHLCRWDGTKSSLGNYILLVKCQAKGTAVSVTQTLASLYVLQCQDADRAKRKKKKKD